LCVTDLDFEPILVHILNKHRCYTVYYVLQHCYMVEVASSNWKM